MAKEIRLSDKERAAIIMFSERHEGTRTEIRRMDKATDVIDHDYISSKITTTMSGHGILIEGGLDKLSEDEEEFVFEDEPFKTLKTFLQNLTIPYSRRKEHVGRILMGVMDKMDNAKNIEVSKKGKDK